MTVANFSLCTAKANGMVRITSPMPGMLLKIMLMIMLMMVLMMLLRMLKMVMMMITNEENEKTREYFPYIFTRESASFRGR